MLQTFNFLYSVHVPDFSFFPIWTKLKILILLSQKFCHLLEISSSFTFFINCSNQVLPDSSSRHFSVEQLTFSKKVLSSCISSSWPWLHLDKLRKSFPSFCLKTKLNLWNVIFCFNWRIFLSVEGTFYTVILFYFSGFIPLFL